MKAINLLETFKDEARLDVIADYIYDAVHKDVFSANPSFEDNSGNVVIGKIGTIVPSKVLGPLYGRFKGIKIIYSLKPLEGYASFNASGVFDPEFKELMVHFPTTFSNGNAAPMVSKAQLHSVIVHELRHALDYSVSKGHAFGNRQTKHASDANSDVDEYRRYQEEVNARMSQALLLVKRKLVIAKNRGKDITNSIIKSAILTSLAEHNLTSIFKTADSSASVEINDEEYPLDNKGFQKLYRRLYKYAQEFIKDL